MASPKRNRHDDGEAQSEFIRIVEDHITSAKWTREQFMAEIKVGEAQFYRWKRGGNQPTKAIVNRIAVFLARRLDEVGQVLPRNPFPASDRIDGLLNELLEAAGYSASVHGKSINSSWQEIEQEGVWRLGYTDVLPDWAKPATKPSGEPALGEEPVGDAIDCAVKVGRLLGIKTKWHYLTWEQVPAALNERTVHGIAPFVLDVPGRYFNYRLSDPWRERGALKPAAVTPRKIGASCFLEDLPANNVQLIYIEGELGGWISDTFDERDYKNRKAYSEMLKAVSYMKAFELEGSEDIPIFCSDDRLCQQIAKANGWEMLKIKYLDDLEFYPTFAFHFEEERLTSSVNSILKMLNRNL